MGRRCGNCGNCGNYGNYGNWEYWESWAPQCKQACWAQKTNKPFCIVPRPIGPKHLGGMPSPKRPAGRRGKGACLQCCATSRWGIQQPGSGWGGAMGTMGTMGIVGTVSTEGSAAMQTGLLGAENKQAFLHRTLANRPKTPWGNALTKQAYWAQKTNKICLSVNNRVTTPCCATGYTY